MNPLATALCFCAITVAGGLYAALVLAQFAINVALLFWLAGQL